MVATPRLVDPNFAGTVLLLLEHGGEGALGIVINRPTDVPVTAVLPPLPGLASPAVIFSGGPVQRQAVIALGRGGSGTPVLPGLTVVNLGDDAAAAGAARVFSGYAGWGAGQLEEEIAAGSWFVVDGRAADALSEEPEGLWHGVLARQGGLYTTASENPSLN